ncbi:MAG: FAD binding domain-containing protein [Planctomycetes bacterium]|nr:FAD binding domain-containing protein [Planctomycetota bacterium]
MKNFEYVLPGSLEEASKAAADGGAKLKAAGVDLLDEMKNTVATPDKVVNLLSVGGMREIVRTKDGWRVGALVTLAQLADSRLPAAITAAAGEAATPQIRNVATVGGNLCQRPRCWYYRNRAYACLRKGGTVCYALEGENRYHAIFHNDACAIVHPSNVAPALLALGATVVTNRRSIPIEEFFVLPSDHVDRENVLEDGEIVTEVQVAQSRWSSAYREERERDSFDWATVSAAVALRMDGAVVKDARVVLGAVAPVPLRSKEGERVLIGQRLTEKIAQAAGEAAFKGATPLSDNAYKRLVGPANLKRAILSAGL